MHTRFPHIVVVAVLTGLLVLTSAFSALGYQKQRDTRLFVSAPKYTNCKRDATVLARLVNLKTGKGVWNQVVRWSIVERKSRKDKFSKARSKTNRKGYARVKLSFGRKAGKRKVKASASGNQTRVRLRCRSGNSTALLAGLTLAHDVDVSKLDASAGTSQSLPPVAQTDGSSMTPELGPLTPAELLDSMPLWSGLQDYGTISSVGASDLMDVRVE